MCKVIRRKFRVLCIYSLDLGILPALAGHPAPSIFNHARRYITAGQFPVGLYGGIKLVVQDAGDDTSSTSIVQHDQRFAWVIVCLCDEAALVQKGERELAGDMFAGLIVSDELVVLEHGLPILLVSHGGIEWLET